MIFTSLTSPMPVLTMQPRLLFPLIMLLFTFNCYSAVNITADIPAFNGRWVIDEELSDDTDKQVEKAIKASGGRIQSRGRGKGRYKGGPKEQAMYDHISYDEILVFDYMDPEFRLRYEDGYERVFFSDGRQRTVSASGTSVGDHLDFSFASWVENSLVVESRPRDGGWTNETYTLESDTQQLRVKMVLKPSSFAEPIHILRIYIRDIKAD